MSKINKVLSYLLFGLLLLGSPANQALADGISDDSSQGGRFQITIDFNDAKEAEWALESINKMKSKKVMQGYEDGNFRPNQPVTRVEAIVTAVRLMGMEEEAKAKSAQTKLFFKDANLIEQQYGWAKGYIAVALENGLFDASEDAIQPDKPASRVWVASLLVRALGLQSEAMKQMTTIPDFQDADQIPAGAVGYINVAVEEGIVSGYPDHTFKPNKHVTRAEMAALLERTNDGLLERSGAITVSGIITDIDFDSSNVTEDVYGNGAAGGTITIKTFNEDSLKFFLSPDLLVQYHSRFIRADQLVKDDQVTLAVKGNTVVEAALAEMTQAPVPGNKEEQEEDNEEAKEDWNSALGIHELEIKIKAGDKQELKLEYKSKNGKTESEMETKSDGHKVKAEGQEAKAFVEKMLEEMALTPVMSKEEIVKQVLSSFQIGQDKVVELEIEIKFSNGKKVEIEIENEEEDDD
ncbi:S-layer homology domain-containing protein [Effusibacillus lacus]|uniref:S-layer domain protein n=1 Tax=Effusibacillus lacus TaxID=1348429 RepID=A0A292YNX5_9BACL|nr:S-layer homology domain-containing protein [Effusibacillus lacus]TCS68279.1 S-layer family protein [Effusibacillus lacus]GAX90170.1 S-layer domain protein [Effusibacillus lacus]